MARPGPLSHAWLQCGRCGARVGAGEAACPACGAYFETALCGRCGFRAERAAFVHNRCPRCGHRGDLGTKVVAPLVAAAAVFLALFLAFSLWR